MKYLAIHNYIEALALAMSLLLLPRLRHSSLRFLPVLLSITVASEMLSITLSATFKINNTAWVYNFFIGLQAIFFFSFYYFLSLKKSIKQIAFFSMLIYGVFYAINLSAIQGFFTFNHLSYLLGSFLVIINSLLCFVELIETNHQSSLIKNSIFWINCASLIFFTGSFFYFLFWYYLVQNAVDDGSLFRNILTVLNLAFYTLIIIGLLCLKKNQK